MCFISLGFQKHLGFGRIWPPKKPYLGTWKDVFGRRKSLWPLGISIPIGQHYLESKGPGPPPCHPRNTAVLRGYINRKNSPKSGEETLALDNPRPLEIPMMKGWTEGELWIHGEWYCKAGKRTYLPWFEWVTVAKLLYIFSDKHLELSRQKWRHWISRFGDLFDVSMMFSG